MNVRVLLTGFGEMGRRYHLQTLVQAGSMVEVVGVVRASQSPIVEIRGVPAFIDHDKAVSRLKPDLVVISTPHAFHASQIRSALENDCHVFVEKPLALDFNEAFELVSIAQARNRLLVVGLQRRYEGFCSVARELMAADRLGSVFFAHGFFAHGFETPDPTGWRSDQALAGSGILDDSAYHIFDILFNCSGGNMKCLIGGKILAGCHGLPHSFSAIVEMSNGATISASGSYVSPRQSIQEEVSVLGSKGSVFGRRFRREWNVDPPGVFYKSRDGSIKEDFDLSVRPSGRTLPLEAMISVLLGLKPRTALLTEAKDTLETHRAITLLKQSQGIPRTEF